MQQGFVRRQLTRRAGNEIDLPFMTLRFVAGIIDNLFDQFLQFDRSLVQFTDAGLLEVIRRYTREAGVRNLERMIANIEVSFGKSQRVERV